MAKTNNIETNKLTNQRLSIQISLSGLSFSILDVSSQTIVALKSFKKSRVLTPLELLDYLKFVIDTEHLKQNTYSQITVIYRNDLSTLVPETLFDETNIADYLKFNNKILPSDFISYDQLSNGTVNVYVPLVNINNYIYDTFGAFTYKHYSTLFIEHLINLKAGLDSNMFVDVDENQFEIAVLKEQKLIFYNTFSYSTKEDFIYYILFTAEQLQMNPETFPLVFSGLIDEDSELYEIAYKYVRHISKGNQDLGFQFEPDMKQVVANNPILLTSFTCE
ncbi:MAG: DUF3822 family protein [Flavobacteriaceae bacterium]|nr:DUF3822 family protein [Mangrovimonas sp.]